MKEAPPPDPLPKNGWGSRGFFCILGFPCWVRSVTCCLVVVTAADRAAATCRHEGCWGCRRFEKICRKYCRWRRGGCQAFALFFRRFAPCAVDCTDAGIIRIKILRGRRLLCKKPLPRIPSRRAAGVRGGFFCILGFPCWMRSVTCCLVVVTAADRAAATCRHEGCWGCRRFEKICRKYCRWRRGGCQAFALFFRRFAPCAVDCTDAGIMLQ